MTLLKKKDQETLTKYFNENMVDPVEMILFTQGKSELDVPIESKCSLCKETEELVQEVSELNDKITNSIHDFIVEKDLAEKYGVEHLPTIILKGKDAAKVRFIGIPSGYEFSSLTKDITLVSQSKTELSETSKKYLKTITEPVNIKVFVTPTCPYCPRAVIMAHQFAMENANITGDMIEASEFIDMSQKYGVMGVPKIVINDKLYFEGALPEDLYLSALKKALGQPIDETTEKKIAQYVKPLKL